ncbi:class I ribonucleotide reductase maintenance protein YfaE [Algicola sagamiensis]|uniref:class I ribonucleotide reductase maintenance protein YfaE n=1 Tax=Algicola sagamiensis TaxID=163869 RepID=UPI000361A8A8|nr:class I ribonucleotide reductase maintenance protein YfaE [Algicola sagamiensis]
MSKQLKVHGQDPIDIDDSCPNLLTALEHHGLHVQYHCREGFCGACRCKLISGEVTYINEPLAFVREGEVLVCCSLPQTDIELEIP